MSRQNPAGFAFSMLFEIAAVVAIVSLLPRIDLRPSVSASQSFEAPAARGFESPPVIETPRWVESSRTNAATPVPTAPPLIDAGSARPQYVEQRLDRASQQLLNSVGGAVNNAAGEWLRPAPVPMASTVNYPLTQQSLAQQSVTPQSVTPQSLAQQHFAPQPEVAARPIVNQPSPWAVRQQPTNQRPSEQRRWLRY